MASVPNPGAGSNRRLLALVAAVHGATLMALARPVDPPISPPRPLTVALLPPPPAPRPAPAARPETPPAPQPKAVPPAKPKVAPPPKPLPQPLAKPEPLSLPPPPTAEPPRESPPQAAVPAMATAPAAPAATPAVPAAMSATPSATPGVAPRPVEAPLEPARFDAAYLRNPPPPYPPLSRRLGEQGKVHLRVHVDAEGLPMEVEIKSSSGSRRLDASALETVRKWRFVPARQGDRPVAAWVVVPINFRLES